MGWLDGARLVAARIDAGDVGIPEVNADSGTLASVLNVVYAWAAIIAVLVIVIAGLFFVLSRGDSQQVTRARNAIIAAAVGLVVVFSAFVITQFILGNVG